MMIDGRVIIEGGEYNFGSFAFTNQGAVYDPIANTWTMQPPPDGWDFFGDTPSVVLPNGKFMMGRKFDMKMAELDPHTLTWTALNSTGKSDWFAEEGWTLLPNGTIPDRRRAEFSQLGALRPDHADLDSGRQHAGSPDGSAGSGLPQRHIGEPIARRAKSVLRSCVLTELFLLPAHSIVANRPVTPRSIHLPHQINPVHG